MNKALTILLTGLSIFSVCHPACAGLLLPTPVGSAAVKGTMVDAVTGKPLPGVIIVATWHDSTPNYFNGQMEGGQLLSCYEVVNVLTTVSGPDGSYEFPAWKGKFAHCQHMAVDQPFMVFYKPGYQNLATAEVPVDKIYDAGSDYSISDYGGRTPMSPLGPHNFVDQDNHVQNLLEYAARLRQAFDQDDKGPCFWEAESPALLTVLREQRRLAAYAPGDLDALEIKSKDMLARPVPDQHCMTPAAMASLEQQASATPLEDPVLPYVGAVNSGDTGTPSAVVSAPPKEIQDYLLEEGAAGHEDDRKAVIYHVDVNPANPYFLALLRVRPEGGTPPEAIDDPKTLSNDGLYGFDCRDDSAAPRAYPGSTSRSQGGPMSQSGQSLPRAGLESDCTWTAALIDSDPSFLFRRGSTNGYRDTYNSKSHVWTLTEHSLVRPKQQALPEILEIHGSDSLAVTTTLTTAGPHRWLLPPPGQAFTLSIALGSVEAEADEACALLLPATLRLQLARDHSGYRLMRVSDEAPGTVGCQSVITGDFTGTGVTSYAFYLIEYDLVQRLAVATPDGAAWTITDWLAKGCVQPKPCRLKSAIPGTYTKASRQWTDPNGRHDPAYIDDGYRTSVSAPAPGILETWGAPISYVHFFVDGKWLYVTLDPSAPSVVTQPVHSASPPVASAADSGNTVLQTRTATIMDGLASGQGGHEIQKLVLDGDSCKVYVDTFGPNGDVSHAYVCHVTSNTPSTPSTRGNLQFNLALAEGIRAYSCGADSSTYYCDAASHDPMSFKLDTMFHANVRELPPTISFGANSVSESPTHERFHFTIKGFDCTLEVEGMGPTRCAFQSWNSDNPRILVVTVSGAFFGQPEPMAMLQVQNMGNNWVVIPPRNGFFTPNKKGQ